MNVLRNADILFRLVLTYAFNVKRVKRELISYNKKKKKIYISYMYVRIHIHKKFLAA